MSKKAFGGLFKKLGQVGRELDQATAVDGAKLSSLGSTDPEKKQAAENAFGIKSVKNVFAGLGMHTIGAEGDEGNPAEPKQTVVATENQPPVSINEKEVQQPQEPVLQPQAEPEKPVVNEPEVVVLPDPVPVDDNPPVQEVKIENPINEPQEQGAELLANDQAQLQEGNQQPVVTTEGDQNPVTEKEESDDSEVALETKPEKQPIIPPTAKPINQEDITTTEGLYLHCTIDPETNEILNFQFYYDKPREEEITPPLGSSLEVDSTNT